MGVNSKTSSSTTQTLRYQAKRILQNHQVTEPKTSRLSTSFNSSWQSTSHLQSNSVVCHTSTPTPPKRTRWSRQSHHTLWISSRRTSSGRKIRAPRYSTIKRKLTTRLSQIRSSLRIGETRCKTLCKLCPGVQVKTRFLRWVIIQGNHPDRLWSIKLRTLRGLLS